MKAEKFFHYASGSPPQSIDRIWHCVDGHTKKGHRLRLIIDDQGQLFWCIWCHMPAVFGSPDCIAEIAKRLTDRGIEFEVMIESSILH